MEVLVDDQNSADGLYEAFVTGDSSYSGFVFRFEAVAAELFICPVKPSLPTGRWVDQCLGCVLRVASRKDNVNLTYRCLVQQEIEFPSQGVSNGERLQAYTWDDGKVEVSLGTLDEDGLCADAGTRLPARWRQPIFGANLAGIYVYSIENRGIVITPPEMMTGEVCELYFLIAWGTYPEAKIDTSFAVDIDYSEHLRRWPGQRPLAVGSG